MKRYYVFRTGRAGDTFDADYEPDALGKWVKFEDAQAEIDRRDARITQLEATQKQGHAALTQQIAENAELKRKLANHAARLGTALKTRTELLGKLRERDARIAELEARVYERDEHLDLLQEELDAWIHTNAIDVLQRRVAELEAEAGVDKALLALADARLNREVLKTKGGV